MRKIVLTLLKFLSPFILLTFIVFLVDPYNLFIVFPIVKTENKIKCLNRTDASAPRGYILWKVIEYQKNPVSNILLGTSRMIGISNSQLSEFFGDESSNLSVDGANYRVIVDLFWMAAETKALKNVLIQADFNTYEAYANYDLFGPVKRILEHKSNYFFSIDIISDTFALLYYSLTKNEEFVKRSYRFRSHLFEGTERNLRKGPSRAYVYPKQFYEELKKISDYCFNENINLIFVIAPDFYEVADFRKMHNLENNYDRFISDINSLGRTVDLNKEISFTMNKDNFMDHYHVKLELADIMLQMISASGQNKAINKGPH